MKKLKKAKTSKMASTGHMESYKPHPVNISIHASGEHMKAAHADLAKQLKVLGFSEKKSSGKKGSKKSIGDALSR